MKQKNQKWYKSKAFIIPAVALMICGFVAAAIYISSINVTATVSEALSTTTTDVSYSGYAGETVCVNVPIDNAANVPLNVELTYAETSNPNNVIYTNNMNPLDTQLAPGTNNINTCVTYDGASPLGDIAGTITINRV